MYVKVIGHLKQFNKPRNIVAFKIRPIEDFNEVTHHMAEVMYAHLAVTKGPPVVRVHALGVWLVDVVQHDVLDSVFIPSLPLLPSVSSLSASLHLSLFPSLPPSFLLSLSSFPPFLAPSLSPSASSIPTTS